MSLIQSTNRRRFLQGLGMCVALPTLESLTRATTAAAASNALAVTANGSPLRMAFLYIPNGVILDSWRPTGTGADYTLNKTMQPLAELKSEFQIVTGFEHQNGTAGPDGAGDHARANATFLTGSRPKKTAGSDIRLGVSVDQVTARQVGHLTRFPSLELSCDGARSSGSCDSGYSCAYQFNLSWRSETTPVAPENNPRLVFERLFGSGSVDERKANLEQRSAEQRSVLDFVLDDAKRLQTELGRNDRNKLDEYLTGVRDIEQRIERAERFGATADPGVAAPDGIPRSYREHLRLMADMLVLAFQTDSTRVASFLLAHDGSNRTFNDIGVNDGHHTLSHHQSNAEKMEKIARIDLFYAEQLAYFLTKMKHTKDNHGQSLLDNSMVVYGSGLSDANRHRHDDLPVIVAGKAGGRFNPGRHVQLPDRTPLSNLFVRMINEMGVRQDRFSDSTGTCDLV